MQPTQVSYKLIKKIKDDRFDEEKLHQYVLLIHLGVRDLQIGVIDEGETRLVLLEDYVLNDLSTTNEWEEVLKDLFDSHPLLQAGFWKRVKIGIKNNKFAQVPDSLFAEDAKVDYLKLNAQIDSSQDVVLHCHNSASKATTVFTFPSNLYHWLKSLYANTHVEFLHQSAALIEGVVTYAQKEKNDPLYIYVDRFKLHILYLKNGSLIYYNQFVIKHFPDYIKFIMLVLKGLSIDQDSSRIILWGYIGKNSPHYQEFCKYVRNVEFGERPANLTFSYFFDEVQEHHFFDLYSIYLLTA